MPDVSATVNLTATEGKPVNLPAGEQVSNADFSREGQDLFLLMPDGHAIRVEGYFDHTPDIVASDGSHLTPQLVQSFLPPSHPGEYAAAGDKAASDATAAPVGKITEVTGEATIIRGGEKIEAKVGAEIFQGDVIQTSAKGGVNILFVDNTTFAISQNAKLAIDQFVYDSESHEGSSFFSMLQGMFVYTSGLIGKEDPGHVGINTPVGSIGIRGTVVAGNIMPEGSNSTITVVDGAVVITNAGGTLEMGDAFDTATLTAYSAAPTDSGQMSGDTFTNTYSAVAPVAGDTFTNVTNGTYQAPGTDVAPTPDTTPDAPQDGSTTAPDGSQAAPDGSQPGTAPMTAPDGATPPPAGTAPAPDGSVPPPPAGTSPDGMQVAPPPPPPAPDGSMLQPPPPPPPPPSTGFADPSQTGGFSDPSAGTFAPPPPPAGGGSGGTTAALPPPPSPTVNPPVLPPTNPPSNPGPVVHLFFDPKYFSFTGGPPSPNSADHGVNLTWNANDIIGHITVTGLPAGMIPTLQINASGPDVQGRTMMPDTLTTYAFDYAVQAAPTVPVMAIQNYNPATGEADLVLLDPLAMVRMANGNFNFSITAHDPLNGFAQVASNNFLVQINTPSAPGSVLQVGSSVNDFMDGSLTPQTIVPHNNDLIYGGNGDDQLAADPLAPLGDTLLGGAGADRFFITTPNFFYVDGGTSGADVDVMELAPGTPAPIFFNFTGATNVTNIEVLKILPSNVGPVLPGHSVSLGLGDVFNMTDGLNGFGFSGHDLVISTDPSTYLSRVNLSLQGYTLDPSSTIGGLGTYNATNAAPITINATMLANGHTVTLIIQPNATATVDLNVTN